MPPDAPVTSTRFPASPESTTCKATSVKVFIISDIEGVAGIVKGEQTRPTPQGDAALFQEGRKLYTEEINAAVRGAKARGETEIVAMDCHGRFNDYTFHPLIP